MKPNPKLPLESVLSRVKNAAPVSLEQMARFEAAVDILNQHVGTCQARIYAEQAKPAPDSTVIDRFQALATEFAERRRTLQSHDTPNIDGVLTAAREVRAALSDG